MTKLFIDISIRLYLCWLKTSHALTVKAFAVKSAGTILVTMTTTLGLQRFQYASTYSMKIKVLWKSIVLDMKGNRLLLILS